jgi:hypothetical protein
LNWQLTTLKSEEDRRMKSKEMPFIGKDKQRGLVDIAETPMQQRDLYNQTQGYLNAQQQEDARKALASGKDVRPIIRSGLQDTREIDSEKQEQEFLDQQFNRAIDKKNKLIDAVATKMSEIENALDALSAAFSGMKKANAEPS